MTHCNLRAAMLAEWIIIAMPGEPSNWSCYVSGGAPCRQDMDRWLCGSLKWTSTQTHHAKTFCTDTNAVTRTCLLRCQWRGLLLLSLQLKYTAIAGEGMLWAGMHGMYRVGTMMCWVSHGLSTGRGWVRKTLSRTILMLPIPAWPAAAAVTLWEDRMTTYGRGMTCAMPLNLSGVHVKAGHRHTIASCKKTRNPFISNCTGLPNAHS